MKAEAGDVIAWLRSRYSWTFATALKFLKNRPPDPMEAQVTTVRKKRKEIDFQQNDYVTVSNYSINPETGAESYGISYNYAIMDDLQKRALELWRDAYKYFHKSGAELWDKLQTFPSRFKPVIDLDIDKCANCETPFDWQAGAVAYAEERAEFITIYGESDEEINGGQIEFTGQLAETDELFIDQDFVICGKCLRDKYARHYKALRLCYRSARRREEAREEERRQEEREREREEERERERLEYLKYDL